MLRQVPVEQPAHDAALAAARVVENAVGLVRAEANLALVHARIFLVRTVGAVLAMMLATSAAQVVLLLVALMPVLFASRQPSAVFLALVPSFCLAGIGAWLAFSAWRGLQKGPETSERPGES